MRNSIVFLFVLLILAPSVKADGLSNEKLLSYCKNFEWAVGQGSVYIEKADDERFKPLIMGQQCSGFLNATRQSIQTDLLKEKICIPEDATLSQLSNIYTKHVSGRPETWHKDAFLGVVTSWKKAFPCK